MGDEICGEVVSADVTMSPPVADAEVNLGFFYTYPLDINDVPNTTEEFQLYAKLSQVFTCSFALASRL